MPARKRKAKDVISKKEDEKITTRRGRQVKRVNYETNYLDDSSDEEYVAINYFIGSLMLKMQIKAKKNLMTNFKLKKVILNQNQS